MEREAGLDAISFQDCGTLLGDVVCEAIYPTFGKRLAAQFARMRVSVAVVAELDTAVEILEDDGIRFSTHEGYNCDNYWPAAMLFFLA